MKKAEKDPLTGKQIVFMRGYSGAGQGIRNFDILKRDGAYYFRFVVPQVKNPVFLHGPGYSMMKVPQDMGTGLAWAVEGREPHWVEPEFSRRDASFGNNSDYRAQWMVGCEDLRELALGKVLRVVTDNFTAEFSLNGFSAYLEKTFKLSQVDLISRNAEICEKAEAKRSDDVRGATP